MARCSATHFLHKLAVTDQHNNNITLFVLINANINTMNRSSLRSKRFRVVLRCLTARKLGREQKSERGSRPISRASKTTKIVFFLAKNATETLATLARTGDTRGYPYRRYPLFKSKQFKSIQINTNQIKCWFLRRGENRSTRRKTSRSRVENHQTQPTYDAESGNRTRATLVGGECSHHCAIPAPVMGDSPAKNPMFNFYLQNRFR